MKSTAFDVHVRTLQCSRCGAPIATGERGGQVTCAYCGTTQVLASRPVAAGAGAKRSMADEVARLSRLKAQQEHPVGAHAYDLTRPATGFRADELGTPQGFERAVRSFQEGRGSADHSSPEAQRDRCWLALAVSEGYQVRAKPLEARAVLETALDELPDEGHRQLVRCRLAVAAIEQGDLGSAAGWLDECDPAPEVLQLDSALREARARLCARKRDGAGVLREVGTRAGDIPLAAEVEPIAILLRVHGLELTGQQNEADAVLDNIGYTFSPLGVVKTLEKQRLAPESAKRLTRRRGMARLESISNSRAGLVRTPLQALGPALAMLPVMAAALMIPITATRCTLDADPLLGVYGYALCAKVCEGCHGPARVVTVWHQTGPGEYSSNGAEYFCPSDANGIAAMSDEQLEEVTYRLDGSSMNFLAANGASYLVLLLLLSPLVPIRAVRRWLHDRGRLAQLDADVEAAATELGVAPPYPPLGGEGRVGRAVLLVGGAAAVAIGMVALGMLVGA